MAVKAMQMQKKKKKKKKLSVERMKGMIRKSLFENKK